MRNFVILTRNGDAPREHHLSGSNILSTLQTFLKYTDGMFPSHVISIQEVPQN